MTQQPNITLSTLSTSERLALVLRAVEFANTFPDTMNIDGIFSTIEDVLGDAALDVYESEVVTDKLAEILSKVISPEEATDMMVAIILEQVAGAYEDECDHCTCV